MEQSNSDLDFDPFADYPRFPKDDPPNFIEWVDHYDNVVRDPRPVTWKELDQTQFPPQKWRIDHLIPHQGFVILAGVSGEKKTWVGLDMARSISQGSNFLNCERFKTEPCNVLYIDVEMPKSELQRRCRQLSFADTESGKILLLNYDVLNFSSQENEHRIWLEHYIKEEKIGVIFVDTFRAVAAGLKEEKAEEVRQFFENFKKYKNESVTFVWLDHFRKSNNFEGKIPKKEFLFGSQDKLASVEVLLMIRSENDEEIHVYQRKNRCGIEIKPFKIIMTDSQQSGAKKTQLTYGGELEEDENAKDRAKEKILDLLPEGGRTATELLKIISSQFKIGSKNTRAALKQLETEKVITVSKQGKSNYYELNKDHDIDLKSLMS